MVTSGCSLTHAEKQYGGRVDNQQVAVTVLEALGLPMAQLDGYRIEGTPSFPVSLPKQGVQSKKVYQVDAM